MPVLTIRRAGRAGCLIAAWTLWIVALVVSGCDGARSERQPTPRADPPQAEIEPDPEPADAAPGAVVVRTRRASHDPVTVKCRRSERLVGGGCRSGGSMEGHPISYSATDTLGAAWICDAEGGLSYADLTAYALCQGVSPATTAPDGTRSAPGSGSGSSDASR